MRRSLILALATLVTWVSDYATAYDTQTHALITRIAYERSVLAKVAANASESDTLGKRLGFDRLDAFEIFRPYWDPHQQTLYYRFGTEFGDFGYPNDAPAEFERCQMARFRELRGARSELADLFANTVDLKNAQKRLPIQNWLIRGAIREDDMGNGPGVLALKGSDCAWEWFNTIDAQPGKITRSFRHFFDPTLDLGLSVAGIEYPKSVDWALGYLDSFRSPATPATGWSRSSYSYLDARNAYWRALTRRWSKEQGDTESAASREHDARDRLMLWATLFRSLGNVVHLLQDSAQPQHTRLDPHSGKDSDQQQAFEGYTNARVLGVGDIGPFVRGFFSSEFQPSVPPLGSYGQSSPIMFSRPARYFSTRSGSGINDQEVLSRAGLADYSNRGFFTGGTLPGMAAEFPHRFPPEDFLDPANGYSISTSPCESEFEIDVRLRNDSICMHYRHVVPDFVDPNYANSSDTFPRGFSLPEAPIAAEGIFLRFARDHNEVNQMSIPTLTWSPAVLDTIGNLTIPRAIGYSAGLIDFFFRGTIELSSPPEGLYAVVDQGTPHHVQDGIPMDEEGRVFGFKKLRVRIRNTTMIDADGNPTLRDRGTGDLVPQTMHAGVDSSWNPTGHLVAIARYHRNPCYQPDLSGEYVTMPDPATGEPNPNDQRVPSGCSLDGTRSAFQEISVSAPIALDANGNLPGNPSGSVNPCVNVGNINSGTHNAGEECEKESVLAEFDFTDDAIPINATDLFLQVAYRGPLGLEDDGIAVGMKDLFEPNYLSGWNGTDGSFALVDTLNKLQESSSWPSPALELPTDTVVNSRQRLFV